MCSYYGETVAKIAARDHDPRHRHSDWHRHWQPEYTEYNWQPGPPRKGLGAPPPPRPGVGALSRRPGARADVRARMPGRLRPLRLPVSARRPLAGWQLLAVLRRAQLTGRLRLRLEVRSWPVFGCHIQVQVGSLAGSGPPGNLKPGRGACLVPPGPDPGARVKCAASRSPRRGASAAPPRQRSLSARDKLPRCGKPASTQY